MASYTPTSGEVFHSQDGVVSVVLNDEFDPNYVPTDEEIEEHADFLGIDVKKEPELLWLARECLVTQLPSGWKPCQTNSGEVYYFNFSSGASMWDHPVDDLFQKRVVEERAKLEEKRSQPAPQKEPKRMLKGAGGNVSGPPQKSTASASTTANTGSSGASRTGHPSPEPIPRTGRLGAPAVGGIPSVTSPVGTTTGPGALQKVALGNVGGGATTFNALNKGIGFGSSGMGAVSSKEPGRRDPKEIEDQMRKRIAGDFATERRGLVVELNKELERVKGEMDQVLAQSRAQLQEAMSGEVSAAKADGERTNQRELDEFYKQLQEEVRSAEGKLKALRERKDAEAHNAFKSYESKLSEYRQNLEGGSNAGSAQKQADGLKALEEFKKEESDKVSAEVEELRKAKQEILERNRKLAEEEIEEAVESARKECDAQSAALREELDLERSEAQQNAKEKSGGGGGVGAVSPEWEKKLTATSEECESAVRAAEERAKNALRAIESEFAQKIQQLRDQRAAQRMQMVSSTTDNGPEGSTGSAEESALQATNAALLDKMAQQLEVETRKGEEELAELERQGESELSELQDSRSRAKEARLALVTAELENEKQSAVKAEHERQAQRLTSLERESDERCDSLRKKFAGLQSQARGGVNVRASPSFQQALQRRQQDWLKGNPEKEREELSMEHYMNKARRDIAANPSSQTQPQQKKQTRTIRDAPTQAEIEKEIKRQVEVLRHERELSAEERLENLRRQLVEENAVLVKRRRVDVERTVTDGLQALASSLRDTLAFSSRDDEDDDEEEDDDGSASDTMLNSGADDELYVSPAEADMRVDALRDSLQDRLDDLESKLATQATAAASASLNTSGFSSASTVQTASGRGNTSTFSQKPPPAPQRSPTPTNNDRVPVNRSSVLYGDGSFQAPSSVPNSALFLSQQQPNSYAILPHQMRIPTSSADTSQQSQYYTTSEKSATQQFTYGVTPATQRIENMSPQQQQQMQMQNSLLHTPRGAMVYTPLAAQTRGGYAGTPFTLRSDFSSIAPMSGLNSLWTSPQKGDSSLPVADKVYAGEGGHPQWLTTIPYRTPGHVNVSTDGAAYHVNPHQLTTAAQSNGPSAKSAEERHTYERRLAKAKGVLVERKRMLRKRQAEIEKAREDWRHDARVAKQRHDREHAKFLKESKKVLEEEGRELNREVLALRRATAWLRDESESYYKDQHQSRNLPSNRVGNNNKASEEGSRSRALQSSGINENNTEHLAHLIEEMLHRTDFLRDELARKNVNDRGRNTHKYQDVVEQKVRASSDHAPMRRDYESNVPAGNVRQVELATVSTSSTRSVPAKEPPVGAASASAPKAAQNSRMNPPSDDDTDSEEDD